MKIDSFILGDFQTNCYCLRTSESETDCLLVDAGLDAQPIIDFLKQNQLNPAIVILTHGHIDHIAGVTLLRQNFPDIKVVIHADDANMLSSPVKNLSIAMGQIFKTEPADIIIQNEGSAEFGPFTFDVLHTPGHTPGGICLYSAEHNLAFVGDTLFAGSIGRTDFPGASFEQLMNSIKTKLLTFPGDTTIYTGHGPATTIICEKQSNPFLR
jgi:glyoxylase-like metal-dependent hydrolase (beta-lactamase superfamily II)